MAASLIVMYENNYTLVCLLKISCLLSEPKQHMMLMSPRFEPFTNISVCKIPTAVKFQNISAIKSFHCCTQQTACCIHCCAHGIHCRALCKLDIFHCTLPTKKCRLSELSVTDTNQILPLLWPL